jgi:hypothetical protein
LQFGERSRLEFVSARLRKQQQLSGRLAAGKLNLRLGRFGQGIRVLDAQLQTALLDPAEEG